MPTPEDDEESATDWLMPCMSVRKLNMGTTGGAARAPPCSNWLRSTYIIFERFCLAAIAFRPCGSKLENAFRLRRLIHFFDNAFVGTPLSRAKAQSNHGQNSLMPVGFPFFLISTCRFFDGDRRRRTRRAMRNRCGFSSLRRVFGQRPVGVIPTCHRRAR